MQTDLIERDEPHALLCRCIETLADGSAGACVLLSGEAGIGKTSLLRAVEKRTAAQADWFWGRCEPLLAPPPLTPLLELLPRLPPDVAAAARAAQMPALLSGMLAWLSETRRPRVLVFDDLQWADGATLDLLRFLARRIESARALLVLAYRDDGLAPPLRQVLSGAMHRSTLRIELPPLSPAAVARLARAAGHDAQQIFAASAGNPFFVGELLADATSSAGVPASVRDAVLARCAHLPAPARELLDLVSVMPSVPEMSQLRELRPWLAASETDDRAGALAACCAAGLLNIETSTLRFRHEIARQVIESALAPEHARALHAEVFESLRAQGASAAHRLHHAQRAGLANWVLELAPLAAHEAAESSAHHQAAALYALALEHVGPLRTAQRAQLLEARANECLLINQLGAAIEARQQALRLRGELGDALGQGINLRTLARLHWLQSGPDQARPLALQALPLLQAAGDERELAMAYATLAQLELLGASSRPALRWGRRALRLAERVGEPEALAYALNSVACARLRSSPDARAWAQMQRSLTLSLEHGLEEHAARAYANLPSLGLVQRRLADTLRWCDEGIDYCAARDLDIVVARLHLRRAVALLELAEWDAATQVMAVVRPLATQTVLEREQALHVRMLLALRRGEMTIDGDQAPADTTDVAAYWRALVAGERQLSLDPWYCPQAPARAEACWLAGDSVGLARIAAQSLPAAIEAEEPWRTGQLACWLARAGALPDGFDKPVALPCAAELSGDFDAAAAAWAALGCRHEQALALAAGNTQQMQRALTLLDALGARPAARRVRARLKALGVRAGTRGPYRAARSDPLSLTPRERRVLEFLREGLSNRDIAERLRRSERTVESHVSALLGKLGVHTRQQAVASAAAAALPEKSVPPASKPGAGY